MNQSSGDISGSYMNCTNLSSHFNSLSVTRGATAGFCFLLCCLTLILICASKTWKSIHQRLFLYLTISTIFYLAVLTMHIEHYFDYSWQDKFCIAVGFLDQYSGTVQLFFALGITLFLFVDVCLKFAKKDFVCLFPCKCCKSPKCTYVPEILFVGLAFLLPVFISIVPFFLVSYGETGPWCWIKSLKSHDCRESVEGFWEQMGLWYIPFAIVAFLSFIFILLMVVVLVFWTTKLQAAQMQVKRLKSSIAEAIPLILFLIVYCLLLAIELTGRILAIKKSLFWMWAMYAVATPLSGAILPIGFLVYYFTKVIRERAGNCLKAWGSGCCLKCCGKDYQVLQPLSEEEAEQGLHSNPATKQHGGYNTVTTFNPESLFRDRHNSDTQVENGE